MIEIQQKSIELITTTSHILCVKTRTNNEKYIVKNLCRKNITITFSQGCTMNKHKHDLDFPMTRNHQKSEDKPKHNMGRKKKNQRMQRPRLLNITRERRKKYRTPKNKGTHSKLLLRPIPSSRRQGKIQKMNGKDNGTNENYRQVSYISRTLVGN